jgi:16S rRNA (guanine1516-N2)-methyltransferase
MPHTRFELKTIHCQLCLVDKTAQFKPFFIDFSNKKNTYRRLSLFSQKEALAKAIGLTAHHKPTVLDLTAGFGQDAFVLAALGASVTLVEQNTMVGHLLKDGLYRARQDPNLAFITQNIHTLHIKNSLCFLETLSPEDYPDVIYLDPMFPKRNKKALVKKPMQILQHLIQTPAQETKLLERSLLTVHKRVVLKRSKQSQPIAIPHCSHFSILGKTSRFEIYIPASI